jgi:hypothetical protein
MFTVIAFFAIAGIAAWSDRQATKEKERPFRFEEDLVQQSIVHAREDLRLIAFVLAALLIMLGIIADKMH